MYWLCTIKFLQKRVKKKLKKTSTVNVPNFDQGYNFEHRKISVFNLPYVQLANMYRCLNLIDNKHKICFDFVSFRITIFWCVQNSSVKIRYIYSIVSFHSIANCFKVLLSQSIYSFEIDNIPNLMSTPFAFSRFEFVELICKNICFQ